MAFNITSEIINEDQTFLKDVQLFAQVETVPPFDSFKVSEKGKIKILFYFNNVLKFVLSIFLSVST